MKHSITAFALLCVLATATLAGDIPSVGITAPSPPPLGNTITMNPGEVPTVGSSYEFADAALDLIQMFIGVGV